MEKQQKILEMAKDICRVKLNCNDVCNPISACDALKYAERAVEAGYSKQSGWISVEDRLPEEYDIILCFNGSDVQSSVFLDDEFIEDDKYEGNPICGVTHWMPLPQPPKMKGGVTAESAIKAVQEAAHKLKGTPPDDLLGIGSTMQF